jgi:hypothetical protein
MICLSLWIVVLNKAGGNALIYNPYVITSSPSHQRKRDISIFNLKKLTKRAILFPENVTGK